MRAFCNCHVLCKAILLLSPAVPVSNRSDHIANKNHVVSEIQQAGLLSSFYHLEFELVASFPKVLFSSPADGAEPDNERSKQYEGEPAWESRTRDIKTVKGWLEEIVEGQTGEHNRHDGRPWTGIRSSQDDRE